MNLARPGAGRRCASVRSELVGWIMPKETRSRHMEGRAVVGDALRVGTVQVIELQAAMIVGPGSAAFEVIRDDYGHVAGLGREPGGGEEPSDARLLGRGGHCLPGLEPALLVLCDEVLRQTGDRRVPRGALAPRVRLADRRPELPDRQVRSRHPWQKLRVGQKRSTMPGRQLRSKLALRSTRLAASRPVDLYLNLHVSPSTAESKRANVYRSSLSAPPSRMRYPPAIVMFGVTS